jgi:DNA polymerase-3 subunit epsilon
MFDCPLAFVDLETTGATATHDRITEVGVVLAGEHGVEREWSTLVNPEKSIPPAIQSLTGITNEMVASAPRFCDIAAELARLLEGRLLIAHNARFDYAFLRNEFRRIGNRYRSTVLCTVKLSRRLYPQHRRHNLDSLIERHGLSCSARHRALGDARVLWELLQCWRSELGAARVAEAAAQAMKQPAVPAGLGADVLDDIPEGPGVYLFYGENNLPLYVGKSVNLRTRVLSHFAADHRVNKDMRIAQQIRRVEWLETAGELGALIREAELVKKLRPAHNRLLRHNGDLCTWLWDADDPDAGAPRLIAAAEIDPARIEHAYGLFRSRRAALDALRDIARAHELCPIVLGLEKGGGPCFAFQIKKCRGACTGREPPALHRARAATALLPLRMRRWPFRGRVGVREQCAEGERIEVHILDRWCYLGSVSSEHELQEFDDTVATHPFDFDTYRILARFIGPRRNGLAIMELD